MLPPFGFELDWIAAFQGAGTLQLIMNGISYFGSEVCVCMLPLIYFGFSRSAGQRLFVLYSISGIAQQFFKLAWQGPRPFWLNSKIKGLGEAGGFGLPSGHTQTATVIWPYVVRVLTLPRIWWAAAVALILLVGVSRVYLGVHFISDALAGWGIGLMLLFGFSWLEDPIAKKLSLATNPQRIALILSTTLSIACLGGLIQMMAGHAPIAGVTIDLVEKARRPEGVFLAVGLWCGAGFGILLARKWARFEVCGPWWKRGVSVVITLLAAWVIRKIAKSVPEVSSVPLQCLLGFLYGLAVNSWLVFLAPWVLLKMNLLSRGPAVAQCPLETSRSSLLH